MNNKGFAPLLVILLVSIVLIGGVSYVYFSGVSQTAFTSGCVQINNPFNPSATYTEVTTSSSYTCDADECVVWGSMNLIKLVATGENIPAVPNGLGSYCCISGTTKTCSNRPYLCSQVIQAYSASFNFCPDPNFPFCSGNKNTLTQSSPGLATTDEFKISKGKTITFNPKYSDGTDVVEKYIYVRKGDCTCANAIQQGNACDQSITNKGMCQECPAGYKIVTPSYNYRNNGATQPLQCTNLFRGQSIGYIWYSGNSACVKSTYENYYQTIPSDCIEPYSTYKKCDGTKAIGTYGATCGDYKSYISCPTGQFCYSDANNKQEVAFGGCKCSVDTCKLGEKETNPLDSQQYRECEQAGNCLKWGDYKYCPQGLIFNGITKSCVCDSTKTCNPGESECTSLSSIKTCSSAIFSGVNCWVWSSPQPCLGEAACNTKGDSLKNDICDCSLANKCKIGDIQCIDSNSYKECSTGETGSCLDYRNIKTVSAIQTCSNNQLITKPGCQFNNPSCSSGFKCVDNQCIGSGCSYGDIKCDSVNFEECKDNSCVCKQDSNSCTLVDYINLNTKCNGDIIQKCIKHNNCYRWEDGDSCPANNYCSIANNKAVCTPTYSYVGILVKDNFAVGEIIKDVTIDVTSSASDANKNIIARLCSGSSCTSENELKRINTYYGTNGKAVIDFGYSQAKSGTLTIEVVVGDPNARNYKTSKQINVLKTLLIKPICTPIQAYINREVKCTWDIVDRDTNSLVTAIPVVVVKQGSGNINYNPSGTNGITFIPTLVGSVEVIITANKDGYLSDTQKLNLEIQQVSRSQTFLIDNQDFFTYSTGVKIGTHQINLKLDESGKPIEVQTINANIITPSGQTVPIIFNKVAEGDYKNTYNFAQAGQVYILKGEVIFTDISKENLLFEYRINTASSTTEDIGGQTNLLIILSIVGGAIIIIVVILLIVLRRRK